MRDPLKVNGGAGSEGENISKPFNLLLFSRKPLPLMRGINLGCFDNLDFSWHALLIIYSKVAQLPILV